MKREKIVLAYSGGLDTSVILKWLQEERGYDVVAMVADLGQGSHELDGVKEKARQTGAVEVYVEDVRREFVTDYLFPLIKVGAVYEGKYLLGTSVARPLIAKKMVEIACRTGAKTVAHGATGKGNDQVRFELGIKALAPDLHIVAPWREWDLRSRSDAEKYAQQYGIPLPGEKIYSIDANLWHKSYEGGVLENPDREPEPEMFQFTNSPKEAPEEDEIIEIEYYRGIPVKVNGNMLEPEVLVEELNHLGAKHGIGRVDLIENRLVGMKSRGVYETPGGTLLYIAHRELEHLCMDRETLHYKEQVALKYGELIYNGQWFTTLRRAMDAFVGVTQQNITGSIQLRLYRGNVEIAGRKSPYSLYHPDLATFEEDDLYDHKDAEGFVNLLGLPIKIQSMLEALLKEESTDEKTLGRTL